jgi:hypothetical protein
MGQTRLSSLSLKRPLSFTICNGDGQEYSYQDTNVWKGSSLKNTIFGFQQSGDVCH